MRDNKHLAVAQLAEFPDGIGEVGGAAPPGQTKWSHWCNSSTMAFTPLESEHNRHGPPE